MHSVSAATLTIIVLLSKAMASAATRRLRQRGVLQCSEQPLQFARFRLGHHVVSTTHKLPCVGAYV